jgi:SAM-dependent methyltransferase
VVSAASFGLKISMPEHDNWDSHWNRYAVAVSRNPAQRMRHGLIVKLLQAGAAPDARVLDLGSGQGDLLVRLHAVLPQAELLGFELSAGGVAISQKKLPDARFLVADLFAPPASVKAFTGWATAAVCSEVLEHVDSPVDFLRAARPYLAEGARLVITVPGGPMSAFDRHIGHRQHFTRDSLTRLLQAAGFTVERVYLSGFPFFNLYRLVVIARGRKLATDVDAGKPGASGWLAGAVMAVFRGLFKLNLVNSPFGWQVVAVVRKTGLG